MQMKYLNVYSITAIHLGAYILYILHYHMDDHAKHGDHVGLSSPAGSTASSSTLQNEAELGDDDVFTVGQLPKHHIEPYRTLRLP